MVLDRNPHFGKDRSFTEGARRVSDMLWDLCEGDLSAFPKSYLETLRHEFSDGQVSMLELIDRVDLGPDATYEDYCEVVDALLCVDAALWPTPEDVVEVQPAGLLYEVDEIDFSEWDFAEDLVAEEAVSQGPQGTTEEIGVEATPANNADPLSEKMELFFKKVISSVYLDGVTEVTDAEGNPPNSANNYLMAPDGKSFSGIFYDSPPNEQARKFPFSIKEGQNGTWQIIY